jgi:hypothetical protein
LPKESSAVVADGGEAGKGLVKIESLLLEAAALSLLDDLVPLGTSQGDADGRRVGCVNVQLGRMGPGAAVVGCDDCGRILICCDVIVGRTISRIAAKTARRLFPDCKIFVVLLKNSQFTI